MTPWYGPDKSSYCNRVSGTDGMVVFPDTTKESVVDLFVSDICRTVWMIFGQSDKYKDAVFRRTSVHRKNFPKIYLVT